LFIPFEERLKSKINQIFIEIESTGIREVLKTDDEIKKYITLKIAQNNLLLFTMLTHGRYRATWAHEVLCKKLEKVERGECKRLIVIAPPRMGKSELSSVKFPIYYLAKNPFHKVMAVSYNASLVNDFGGKARDTAMCQAYYDIWNVDYPESDPKDLPLVSKKSKAVNKFALINGTEYIGQGLKGSIVGKGGHVIICDDWIKSYLDLSGNKMESDWEFYTSTLYNRQEDDKIKGSAAFVVVQTHWHKKDLIGRLLDDAENGGDQWEVFHISAEATKNEFYSKEDFYYYN
jgi:hypothetical protein